ncbi:MAG: hypothetical protein ACYC0V_07325 [Armatimonadota bacterium]
MRHLTPERNGTATFSYSHEMGDHESERSGVRRSLYRFRVGARNDIMRRMRLEAVGWMPANAHNPSDLSLQPPLNKYLAQKDFMNYNRMK